MILISSCLAGEFCRYDGGGFFHERLTDLIASHDALAFCPETAVGLPIPRNPIELTPERIPIQNNGEMLTVSLKEAVSRLAQIIDLHDLTAAVLKDRSPSCGSTVIYDGTFTGTLIAGKGLFAEALEELGIPIYTEHTYEKLLNLML